MAISGSFASMSPSDLLQMLLWGRKTGLLTCAGKDDRHHLFLEDGNVVGVTSSRYTDRLGAVLVRLGYLSEDLFEEVFLAHASDNRKIGEIVLEKQLMPPESLQHALVVQAEDVICDLLTWNDGEFSFEERPLRQEEMKIKPVVISTLLLEGARRMDEIRRCRELIKDYDQVYMLNLRDADVFNSLSRPEKTVFSLLETPQSLHDLLHIANETEYDLLSAVYHLYKREIICVDTDATNLRKEQNVRIDYLLELTDVMEKKGWFHEALSNITESNLETCGIPAIRQIKERLEKKVFETAERVFGSSETIPKIRQAVADVSIDKLSLNHREGFVLFRIDGNTNLRNLRHLTGYSQKELYIILHKFMRMGLIYFDESVRVGSKIKK